VWRLMTSSYAVNASTGRSAGTSASGRQLRSIRQFSPIQNNSDPAQGPLPIRPSKVRRSDIYLAPGGVHGTETKTN